jgi:hypothetical protein
VENSATFTAVKIIIRDGKPHLLVTIPGESLTKLGTTLAFPPPPPHFSHLHSWQAWRSAAIAHLWALTTFYWWVFLKTTSVSRGVLFVCALPLQQRENAV